MSAPDTGLDAALRRLAAEVAPDLLGQVMEESRRDAAGILRARFTAAMVEQMEMLIRDEAPRTEVPEPATAEAAPEPAAGEAAPEPARSGPLTGWYVYGLTWESAARALQVDAGIDGAPVEVVAAGRLAAVVSPLTTTEPWGGGSDGDVDLDVLAPRARRHEWVLEQMLDRGAVVPLRFGVLYPSLDRLRSLLSDRATALAETLRRLENQTEWGLTIAVDESGSGGNISPLPTAGRDYLTQRRDERLAAEEMIEEATRVVAGIHDTLLEVASESVVHPAARGDGRKEKAMLRASYLVPAPAVDRFRTVAEAGLSSSPLWLRLTGELTGPWPPYHFCAISLDQVPA